MGIYGNRLFLLFRDMWFLDLRFIKRETELGNGNRLCFPLFRGLPIQNVLLSNWFRSARNWFFLCKKLNLLLETARSFRKGGIFLMRCLGGKTDRLFLVEALIARDILPIPITESLHHIFLTGTSQFFRISLKIPASDAPSALSDSIRREATPILGSTSHGHLLLTQATGIAVSSSRLCNIQKNRYDPRPEA